MTNYTRTRFLRDTVSGFALSLVTMFCFAQTAGAQVADESSASAQAATDVAEDEVITVVGTHIPGGHAIGSPVETYSAEDIAESGDVRLDRFILRIPQVSPNSVRSTSPIQRASNRDSGLNSGLSSGLDLRGLGAGGTLTLLNGRRLPGGKAGFGDIAAIPTIAIQRMQVLTDGASAIYGADAVAGVVNIVTNTDPSRIVSEVEYGSVTDGGMNELRLAQAGGFTWNGGHVTGAIEHFNAEPLLAGERDFFWASPPAARNSEFATLYPDDSRTALVLGAEQQGPFRSDVRLDVLWNNRETNVTYGPNASLRRESHDVETRMASGSWSIPLRGDWRVELGGSYGKQSVDGVATQVGVTAAAQPPHVDVSAADLDVRATGQMSALGRDIQFAFGAGAGTQELEQRTTAAVSSASLERDAHFAFVEASTDLLRNWGAVESLALSLAGRYDEYSDFGGDFNPKIGLEVNIAGGLRLRSSYGTSFRAPTLVDLSHLNKVVQTAAAPDPANPSTIVNFLFRQDVVPDLGPERAETYSVGFDWQPNDTLRLSSTYFHIEYEDRIDLLIPFTIYLNEGLYSDLFIRNPSGQEVADIFAAARASGVQIVDFLNVPNDQYDVIIDARTRNLALSRVEGLDVSFDWRTAFLGGGLNVRGGATYYFDYVEQPLARLPEVSVLDTTGRLTNLRGYVSGQWTLGDWLASMTINYTDGYDNTLAAGETVDAWTTMDLGVAWRPEQMIEGVTLALTVQNVTDEAPPFVRNTPLSIDAANAAPLGRFAVLRISKVF